LWVIQQEGANFKKYKKFPISACYIAAVILLVQTINELHKRAIVKDQVGKRG